ncbi:acyl-CoA desaturase [Kordia sp. YSTF-M3]|uniref:Acyl-CoA desaturase n=1 Tax=Kordia aestuariivivens TaxID=2759037 RepID=A0ABR7Q465_9FLAO|nr:acyl-CoA desaturase [Kordia aestuariivivens]MBC8753355.1 acyl-CoA desaturase [Kordia aestuariivivens]
MKAKITFPKEPDFFYKDACKEVQAYFETNQIDKYGSNALLLKYVLLKVVCVFSYLLIFYFQNSYRVYLPFVMLGPLGIILALNISHDAIHGVAHSKKWINSYFTMQMDLIGANSFVWKKRHQFGHHTFPNTLGKDPDLTQTEIVKILPKATHKFYHKFQHLYVPFLYSVYTINWIYIRDFTDFFSKNSLLKNIPKKEYLKLITFKLLYISIFILVPFFYTSLSITQVVFGNLLMHISASYFLTLVLVPSHVSENSVFITPDSDGKMPYSWSHHQVITTTDFATNSYLTTWLLGGFNHHVVHHLFPNVSHVHYPKMTPIIKRLAKKYGLEYNHESSALHAYISHYNLLKNHGKQ